MPGFGITRRSRHGLVVVLMLGFACLSGPAAQEPPRERRDQPDRMKRDGRRDRHPRRPQHGRGRGLGPRELTRFLFRITPEDRVPLREGEEAELLDFAQEHSPRIHEALTRLRDRSPERYQAKFNEILPRLRHMRRVFAYSPDIGDIIRQHAENGFQIRRLVHSLRREEEGTAIHDKVLQSLRERVAKGVRLEIRALETLHKAYEGSRSERIANRLDYMIGEDVDITPFDPTTRDLLQQFHLSEDDAERTEILARLETRTTKHIDDEVQGMGKRIEQLRKRAPKEVDHRMQRITKDMHRGPKPDRDRDQPRGDRRGRN